MAGPAPDRVALDEAAGVGVVLARRQYAGDYERNVGQGDGAVAVTRDYYASLGPLKRLVACRKGGVLHWSGRTTWAARSGCST